MVLKEFKGKQTVLVIGGVILFTLILFLPFFLKPRTLVHVAANIESMMWWCLLSFVMAGILHSVIKETRKTVLMLSVFIFWLSIIALTQGNMGTLMRQKDIIYYIGFIFVGVGIDRTLRAIEGERGK